MLCERISDEKCWDLLEQASIRIVTAGGMSAMGFYREAADRMVELESVRKDPILEGLLQSYINQGKNPPTRADLEATSTIIRIADSLLLPLSADLTCGLAYLGEETVKPDYRRWLEHELGNSITRKVHDPRHFFASRQNVLRVILDGLDGTANFSRGLPLFCSAVAILVDDQARVGAMYDPIHNIVYSGILPGPHNDPARGASASAWEVAAGNRIDLVKLAAAQENMPLSREAIGIHLTRSDPTKLREFLGTLENLALACGAVYALNTGIPAMANVARGGLGAFLNNHTNPWDVAAGEVLVRACGGTVTGYDGEGIEYNSSERLSVLASKAHLHSTLLQIVRGTPE